MSLVTDLLAGSPEEIAAVVKSWHPKSTKEVDDELSRLRELARRVRVYPTNARSYAKRWLHPPDKLPAAIERWCTTFPEFPPNGDLLDTCLLLEAIAKGEIGDPETTAGRLEFFADVLKPLLIGWLDELQATPEAKQAEDRAKMVLFRVLVNRELPKYATKAVLANPVAAMLRAGNAMEATDLNPGEMLPHVVIRRQADWSRHKNLLLRVVDAAAVEVVRYGGDPAPLFAIGAIANQGKANEFSEQWPAVEIALRTAEAKRKAAALAGKVNDAQEPAERAGEVGDKGVSLRDIGLALGYADEAVTDFAKRFSDSKRIKAEPLGKCPVDGRCKLYRLSEILSDFKEFSPLKQSEVPAIRKFLESVARLPAK